IYVQTFPTTGAKRQISVAGGDQPQWRADQKELYYVAPDGKLMAVDVNTDSGFEIWIPKALFDTHVPSIPLVGNDRNQYLAMRDGQKFLVNRVAIEGAPTPITIVFNWTQLAKK